MLHEPGPLVRRRRAMRHRSVLALAVIAVAGTPGVAHAVAGRPEPPWKIDPHLFAANLALEDAPRAPWSSPR